MKCLCQAAESHWETAFVLYRERRRQTGYVLIRTQCDESVSSPRQGFGRDSSQSRGGRKRMTEIFMEFNDLALPLSFTLLFILLPDIFFPKCVTIEAGQVQIS